MADRLSNAVVCNAQAVLDDVKRAGGVPDRKARVIRNGVEVAPASSPPPSASPLTILVSANLIAYKGHAVLLDAFALATERLGPGALRLQLAGRGPEEPFLMARAAELRIEEDVEFLGSVPDVRPLLERCSFTVLPSFTEGMPNAVLESLGVGRAVIATRVGGVPEILCHGGGIMVAPRDPVALASSMVELAADPVLTAALGAEGLAVATSRFSMERMVDETAGLYAELLDRKGFRGALVPAPRAPVAVVEAF